MAKDRFGYGTEVDVSEKIKADFGKSFGSDLSLLVLMHHEDTGELLKLKDIDEKKVKELKDKYMDRLMDLNG